MSILLIAGSPSERSRSAALLSSVGQRLESRGFDAETLSIRDLPPQALTLADFGNPSLIRATSQVIEADIVVVATPVYKAAYSGLLKVFLDLLPQAAFKGKTLLPLATGGSPHHMLALDYALRPVLQSLGARYILPGIFATDSQVIINPEGGYQLDEEIGDRLDESVNILVNDHITPWLTTAGHFSNVNTPQLQCSA